MVAESTPFGGIVDGEGGEVGEGGSGGLNSGKLGSNSITNRAGYRGFTWDIWFKPLLAWIEFNDIEAWCYINCDWDAQPMWQKNHAPGAYWGDTRIESKGGKAIYWDYIYYILCEFVLSPFCYFAYLQQIL